MARGQPAGAVNVRLLGYFMWALGTQMAPFGNRTAYMHAARKVTDCLPASWLCCTTGVAHAHQGQPRGPGGDGPPLHRHQLMPQPSGRAAHPELAAG